MEQIILILLAILISLLILLAGGYGVSALIRSQANKEVRLRLLEEKVAEEEAQRKELEEVGGLKKHYTYNTKAAMQDIAARALGLKLDIDVFEGGLDTIRMIANSIAADPSAYDPERPNGRKGTPMTD